MNNDLLKPPGYDAMKALQLKQSKDDLQRYYHENPVAAIKKLFRSK